jgi:heme/copper-type cytochrome/quinol oxidase subunit 2
MGVTNMKLFRIFGAILAMLAAVPGVLAQGCALCYTYASAEGAHAQKQLDFGILALLIPSLLLFVSVFVLLLRRAHSAGA